MLAEKIYKIQKELEEKRIQRQRGPNASIASTPGSLPQAALDPHGHPFPGQQPQQQQPPQQQLVMQNNAPGNPVLLRSPSAIGMYFNSTNNVI